MKNVLYLLMLFAVCASVTAGFSYSVGGKVYTSGTGTVVPNATVTFEIEFVPGSNIWTNASTITANDGSYSFSTTSDTDPKGKNMRLKASKNFLAGGKTWVCAGYSETWDIWMSSTVGINPDLSVVVEPSHFAHVGTQLPVTTVAYLDQTGMSVEVQQFVVKLAWNPAQMDLARVQRSLDSFFDVTDFVFTGPGSADVYGQAPWPVSIPPIVPESFFDVFFDVILPPESMPAISTVTVSDKSELYDGVMEMHYPYQHQSEYLLGEPEKCKAGFLIDSYHEWEEALNASRPQANIRPATETHWQQYMNYWNDPLTEKDGMPYPPSTFIPAAWPDGMLYVYGGGGGGGMPEDAGLVMAWGTNPPPQEGNYASAWQWDYGLDPDLSNCTIQVTVSPMTPNINIVSFSIVDIANRMRTWWWSVPAAIPSGGPTTVKINTAIAGIGAATPPATGYMNVPGFDITQSQFFDVDENFQYIFGQQPVPPPGQQVFVYGWNYWHNLLVTKNTQAYKGTWPKYSQPPVVLDPNDTVPMISGWDEISVYKPGQWPIMADDWVCLDERPVTDIHWWGSFKGWMQPYLPPVLPKAFHLGIWTDVPVGPNEQFSHPGTLIWEHVCDNWVWNFAGYDLDPRCNYPGMPCEKNEACFQFNQLLSEDDWFFQKPSEDPDHPNIYWLSIAAIYDDNATIMNPWGWKTRPHLFNDDAVRIFMTTDGIWPPNVGSVYGNGIPVQIPEYPDPEGETWDLAFELTTNKKPPCHNLDGDINHDCIVDLKDFADMASDWLKTSS
ncbi:MAG: carboxypeptidase-like regulatory domain-containing protein [Planctomycetales bacterium]|nr:carboxypeptidase-like regulatory domain-containing protein [Planctomycetales bacterium]